MTQPRRAFLGRRRCDCEDDERDPGADAEAASIAENDIVPEELQAFLTDNEVMMTQAKKARAEAEKARDFYRAPGGPPGGGRGPNSERIKKLKLRLPCARCGRLGALERRPRVS